MKRGLIARDPSDAVRASAEQRVTAVRERVREAGCVVGLVYGDVSRSDDISYLGTLCVYWNEGILAVPADGDVAFITKLSPRVHPWMRASSTVTDLRSGPNLPKLIGGLLEDLQAEPQPRIGLVERDWWPSGLLADIAAAFPEAELADLGDVVRAARLVPDAGELDLLRRAGVVAGEAVQSAIDLEGSAPAARIGEIERRVRRAGMTDLFAVAEEAPDGSVTTGAVVQLQHLWLRAARSGGGALAEHATVGAARATAALRDGVTEAEVAQAARDGVPADVTLTTVCVRHVDLTPVGDGRRPSDVDGPLRAGEVVAVAVTASDDRAQATVADTHLLSDDGATALTRPEERTA